MGHTVGTADTCTAVSFPINKSVVTQTNAATLHRLVPVGGGECRIDRQRTMS
jgi:hypothetical protein